MSDISIEKALSNRNSSNFQQVDGYTKLKKDYESFLKKAEKSDLANSLTMKQKQLEMLKELHSAALREGKESDCEVIKDSIELLNSEIELMSKDSGMSIEYNPSTHFVPKKTDLVARFNACKNSKGEVDNATRRIVLAFKDEDVNLKNLSRMVEQCRGLEEVISDETVKSIEKLCEAKVAPDVIFNAIDESQALQTGDFGTIDFSWVDDMLMYKLMGLCDSDSLRYSKTLTKNYTNKQDVFNSIPKLMKAGFDLSTISKLVSIFSLPANESGQTIFSMQGMNSAIAMKNTLFSTRTAERNERQNPINKLNQYTITFDDAVIVMKDDKVVEYVRTGDKSFQSAKRDYNEVATEVENAIVYDFSQKYKTKEGKLDTDALRTFTSLRSAGITYEHLLPLVEECLSIVPADEEKGVASHYEMDVAKISAIKTLKNAGALSSDIMPILSSIRKDDDGSYNQVDIKNACDLTSSVIAGKEVISLLSEVRKDEELKQFVLSFSSILEKKADLLDLVSLIKDSDGNFDDNAAEILYNLAEHFLYTEGMQMKDKEFIDYAGKVISASISSTTQKVDENSTNICIAMCRNQESSENLLKALELCKDEYGYTSESLADIVWDMSKQQSTFDSIVELINICKPVSGILDIERASVISDLLDNGYAPNEVMDFAKNLGTN